MVRREVASLAKGINRRSVNSGGNCDGHDDSGLIVIKFSCKIGYYREPGEVGAPSKIRLIFATREDAVKAMQTIFETAKEHFVILMSMRGYTLYGEENAILQMSSNGNVTYVVENGAGYVNFHLGNSSIIITKAEDYGQQIDSPDASFITEEYASTVSGLQHAPDAPYGSLIIVTVP